MATLGMGLGLVGAAAGAFFFFPMVSSAVAALFAARCAVGFSTKPHPRQLHKYVDGKSDASTTIFMIHGWPDNKEIWTEQVKHLGKKYRIVRVDLPNFDGKNSEPWGCTFDELSDLCAKALREDLQETGQENAVLMIHDWGAVVGGQLQRRFPELVQKMVVLDVAWTPTGMKLKHAPVMLIMGLLYQFWAATCFFIAAGVPVVGPGVANAMLKMLLQAMGGVPHTSFKNRNGPPPALMCYPYWHFQKEYLLTNFGLMGSFDTRHKIGKDRKFWWQEVPSLFIHGADKGFDFHPPFVVGSINKVKGCKAFGIKKGEQGCPRKVGHWVQWTAAERINSEVSSWLSSSE